MMTKKKDIRELAILSDVFATVECVVNLKLPIIRKKRDLCKDIHVSDDLIWEDREKKKQLEFIVNAFELDKRLSTWQFIY